MLNDFLLTSLLIYSIFGCVIFLGYILQYRKEKNIFKSTEEKIDLNQLVVIIPFRNEEFRIQGLIDCINNLTIFPKKFIFVDDHSSDNSIKIINKLKSYISFEILSLPDGLEGKKVAIRYAINHQKSEFNLTLDADIQLKSTYFEFIQSLPKKDLYVLPVIMKGRNILENYFESDHALANAINTSISGLKRPFLASGANLLFNQKTFIEVDNFESHSHISSGDDVFLLRDFRLKNKSIELISHSNFAVTTGSPKTLREFFQQRLRWIGNGKEVKDQLSSFFAGLSFVFNLLFVSVFIYYLVNSDWRMFFTSFALKTVIDQLVYFPYFLKIKRLKTWIEIPLFSVIQPFYLLVLLVLLIVYKPVWKGRLLN